jgi:hypothetical protein
MNATVTQTPVQTLNLKELNELVQTLAARIVVLEEAAKKPETVEMTDDHARRILNGDLATKSHKDAAAALNLTYGQVYSARLEFTFKKIHKELKDKGWKNTWVK